MYRCLISATTLIAAYDINPAIIPLAILYVNGNMVAVKNAGNASSIQSQSIYLPIDIINIPTITNGADDATDGTLSSKGISGIEQRKHMPITSAFRPVRPPLEMPAMVSL